MSRSGTSSINSAPHVAAPYAMFRSLNGCRIWRPSSALIGPVPHRGGNTIDKHHFGAKVAAPVDAQRIGCF